jgi:hypothetical protein
MKGNHYPSDDPEIVANDRFNTCTRKLAYCVVMMADSGLKFAKKKWKNVRLQTAMHRKGN